jgi:hypothetical protein
VAALIIVSACNTNKDNGNNNNPPGNGADPVLSEMMQHKISHVGDSSGVAKLLNYLPEFDENFQRGMYSLQTNIEPYGLTIYYDPAENFDGATEAKMEPNQEMEKYANYLIQCIDNLGYVEYYFLDTVIEDERRTGSYVSILKVEEKDETP